ncbi:MAG: hypothetical protein D6677_04025 [Calditrichaeota bacterium]|nr:MAG: hypothetical protein D6677_04025 [Calditrichota bacterium]
MKKTLVIVWLLAPLLTAQGFYFGRNKVQYTRFDWQVMETEHFNIYYYPEMEDMARRGAALAEEAFRDLQPRFNHYINRRIPLIFYSTHLHFQQTNITPGFIPEGVGGFFEFIKGRVVIPSNGNLHNFRHVIRHELVHVFMHAKVSTVLRDHNKVDGPFPPLWFTEGLAELWSTDWDARGEMIIKDAVLNNYELGLKNIYVVNGTFSMYKIGQHILGYISQKYGADKLLLIMTALWKHEKFEDAFQEAIGKDYEEFDKEYLYYLKKKYYPLMARTDFISQKSDALQEEGFNFKPVYYREKDRDAVLYLGNHSGYASIFLQYTDIGDEEEPPEPEVLVRGEATSDFESFHIFDSKISVSRAGLLAFSAKSGAHDVLYIYNVPERRLLGKMPLETTDGTQLAGIYSPSWDATGERLVFSGLSMAGYKDLYLFDYRRKRLKRLTRDVYDDFDPVFTPRGRIIFGSDRGAFGGEGATNLFSCDSNGTDIRYLTYGRQHDAAPAVSADGQWLAFTSDREGTANIYLMRRPFQAGLPQTARLTRAVGTLFDPAWTPDGDLLFSAFESRRFQIRRMNNVLRQQDTLAFQPLRFAPPAADGWLYPTISAKGIRAKRRYEKEYTLDIAQSQLSQDPVFGTTGGAAFSFSDVLGNDIYNILVYNNARTSSDILSSFNFAVNHISLEKKVNYAYGVFRFAGEYFNPEDAFYYEDRAGGSISIFYPLSTFSRISFSQSLSYSDKNWGFGRRRFAWLNASFLSFVHDNALWTPTGPIDGWRFNVTLGNTYDFAFNNVNYLTGLFDFRYYQRLSLRTSYAVRLYTLFNAGKEARQFYFGGSWDLRGVPRWSLHGQRIFLVSQEFRFPLVDAVGVKLPFLSLGFRSIRGAVFLDAGNAWNDTLTSVRGSYGLGVRLPLGFLVLRWDFGRRTDFRDWDQGGFTQFFFGWDF